MSLFDKLGQQTANPQQQDPRQALQQLKADPRAALARAGMNVPAGMTDPNQIINHLVQSGQVTNPRLQMAQRMMSMFRR